MPDIDRVLKENFGFDRFKTGQKAVVRAITDGHSAAAIFPTGAGKSTLAAALSEPRDAIEDIIEPYLIQTGLVQRTPRGRVLSPSGYAHLGLPLPAGTHGSEGADQLNLLAGDGGEDGS